MSSRRVVVMPDNAGMGQDGGAQQDVRIQQDGGRSMLRPYGWDSGMGDPGGRCPELRDSFVILGVTSAGILILSLYNHNKFRVSRVILLRGKESL